MLKLSNRQVNLLIEYIREKPVMYEKESHQYRPADLNKFWWEIADNLQVHVNDCKRAWRSLRDQYCKSLREGKTNSEDRKPYKYSEQLAFLKNCIRHKSAMSADDVDNDETNEMPSTSKRVTTDESFKKFNYELDPLYTDDENSAMPAMSERAASVASSCTRDEIKKDANEEYSEFLEKLLAMNEKSMQEKQNGTHKFFENLADTLVNFNIPELELLEIQSKIFAYTLELLKDWHANQNIT